MENVATPIDIELFFEPDTELAERDLQPFSVNLIRESKVTTTATHVHYGKFNGKTACLVVLLCNFIPTYQVRFKYVEIELKIVRADGSSIIAYQPHAWEGRAGALPVERISTTDGKVGGSGGGAEGGLETSYKRYTERTEIKKAQIFSVLEGLTVTWHLSENDVAREGVPNPFRAALIVETDGKFSIRVEYQAKLSKSVDPRSWKSAHARLTQPLDLSQSSVGQGIGPAVAGLDEMEKDFFDLSKFILSKWDLRNSLMDAVVADPPRIHEYYQIGIICALAIEKAAMVAMMDETHPKLKKERGDENEYTLGRIGAHNIVVACLPAGLTGNGPAAIVANNMLRSFPIKFGLMVGIGGGVWSKKNDIRLGDIVVSQPTGTHGGVVQWDFGKMGKSGRFQRTGSLNKPPLVLLHALSELKTFDLSDGVDIEKPLSYMVQNKPRMSQTYKYQGADRDQLFEATYDHEGGETCDRCDHKLIVQRPARGSTPKIHYGNIASGNEVMKHGTTRDIIAKEEDVICFEMEAAGLMDNFRCLVIRGVSDYADSHKVKIWQPYAAATAAAFAKVLLGFINEQEVIKAPRE